MNPIRTSNENFHWEPPVSTRHHKRSLLAAKNDALAWQRPSLVYGKHYPIVRYWDTVNQKIVNQVIWWLIWLIWVLTKRVLSCVRSQDLKISDWKSGWNFEHHQKAPSECLLAPNKNDKPMIVKQWVAFLTLEKLSHKALKEFLSKWFSIRFSKKRIWLSFWKSPPQTPSQAPSV